jgi:drug/metabolite transporter (DMT)-like permease
MTISNSTHPRAIAFALAGFTLWAGSDAFAKLAGELGVPRYEIITLSSFSGLIVILLFSLLRGNLSRLRPRHIKGLGLMGLMFASNYVFLLAALAHLPLANLYTVTFLSPLLVAALAAKVFQEKLDTRKLLAILAGFAGVVIAVNPSYVFQDRNLWLGYGAAFGALLTVAGQQFIMRFLSDHESRESIAFYPRVVGLIGGLVATLTLGLQFPPTMGLLYSLAGGVTGGIGWLVLAHAFRLAPTAIVASFHYAQMIVAACIGYLVWHDVPSLHLEVGAFVIILSGLYIIRHARKTESMVTETPV